MPPAEQLTLDVDRPLHMIAQCSWCGARSEPIPVTESDWHEPILWGYLAVREHEAGGCPALAEAVALLLSPLAH